ncbi:MAG: class I SAM-dependent methyltransferase, partial [Candidatus Acidiferrales bacterium]
MKDIAPSAGIRAQLSEEERTRVRTVIFCHLAGIVLAPVVQALWERGVFELFDHPSEWVDLEEIVKRMHANRGYLHVALRLLASHGWLKQRKEVEAANPCYALTPEGRIAMAFAPMSYAEATAFLPKSLFLEDFLFGKSDAPILPSLQYFVQRAQDRWGIGSAGEPVETKVKEQVRRHLNGILIGPAMVALARGGVLAQLERGPAEIRELAGNPASLSCVLDLLATQGWVAREGDHVCLTPSGNYAAQIATSYGVTVSYVPLMNVVSVLLFGNPRIPRMDESGVELLVNRGMNVWGSGGAHKTYFKKVDEIIVEIFNRPLENQPQGICDMGCGDGTFLKHLHSVVKTCTLRGQVLEKHPLILVGADFNKVARRVAKQNLRKAEVPECHVIPGDINRPAQLASDLEELGLDIHDLLHVRSFLD